MNEISILIFLSFFGPFLSFCQDQDIGMNSKRKSEAAKKGYFFEDEALQEELIDYLSKRNDQICFYALSNSWYEIAKKIGLSKQYVKTICHKRGIKR